MSKLTTTIRCHSSLPREPSKPGQRSVLFSAHRHLEPLTLRTQHWCSWTRERLFYCDGFFFFWFFYVFVGFILGAELKVMAVFADSLSKSTHTYPNKYTLYDRRGQTKARGPHMAHLASKSGQWNSESQSLWFMHYNKSTVISVCTANWRQT